MAINTTEMLKKHIDNMYILNGIYKLGGFVNNLRIDKIVKKYSTMDSIKNYIYFSQNISQDLLKSNISLWYKNIYSESNLYGHFKAICKYAEKEEYSPLSIFLEHGVNFSINEIPPFVVKGNTSLIYQSDYKKDFIHSDNSIKPVFSIGPYIHYADSYYNIRELRELKKNYGRTLLVYTNHTYENSYIERNFEEYYNKLLKPFEFEYDSILVCVYWHDVDDEFYNFVKAEKKIHLVSAGIREDPNFIRRTKSLIDLADTIVITDIGTYVGYAIYMKKELIYVACNDKYVDNSMNSTEILNTKYNKQLVIDAIKSRDKVFINEVYNKFWGGDQIKSKEEIGAILDGSNEILKKSLGFKDKFNEKTLELLKIWKMTDSIKYKLFKNAVDI